MYKQIILEHFVEIPPELFGSPKETSAYKILAKEYQGIIDPELGMVIAICEIIEVGPGKIIHGSPGTFHPVKFSVLTYVPTINEVVEGEVVELVYFGVFIRLGPNDGLCHISQVSNDNFTYENVNARFLGESGKILQLHDHIRARVVSVSAETGAGHSRRLGLTMRQPYLGKSEWIDAEIQKQTKIPSQGAPGAGEKAGKSAKTEKDEKPAKVEKDEKPAVEAPSDAAVEPAEEEPKKGKKSSKKSSKK